MEDGREQQQSLLASDERSKNSDYATLTDVADDQETNESSLLATNNKDRETLPLWNIAFILSTAFCYGCILTTLFLITLPVECERINLDHPNIPKSVALGIFVAIAGVTQLISPFVGRLSDTYVPPVPHDLGQRMPYLVLGSICTCIGLLGQVLASTGGFWIRYSFAFFLHMIGLNIIYSMMIALIPDQVPTHQTGVANGVLAFLLVTGSLFGFGMFHSFLSQNVRSMYGLYICIVIVASILTGTHAHDADAELAYQRKYRRLRRHVQSDHNLAQLPERLASPPNQRRWQKAAKKAARKAQEIVVLTPTLILKTMLVDTIRKLNWRALLKSYTIDTEKHHDFFIVTVSRLFYYCGMSVQTFFMYFLHDIINVRKNPEAAVASLAILGQCSGAITCYPVGWLSDSVFGGRRKPFVFFSCAVLSCTTLAIIFATTLHHMVIAGLVLGAANGIYLTMDTSLAVDTLPKDLENISNEDGDEVSDGSAQLLGIWGVAAFLGSALGPMIGGPLLYYFGHKTVGDQQGFDEAVPEEYTLKGYAVVLSLSSFYFLLSALSLRYIRDHQE